MIPNEGSRYTTVNGCAAYIGRTPKAVYRLVDRGEIPYVRVGRKLQFDLGSIERWMQRHARKGAHLL